MAKTQDICWMSATDLAQLIKTKKLSPVEVVGSFLKRIAAVNPKLNAYVTLTADSAMAFLLSMVNEGILCCLFRHQVGSSYPSPTPKKMSKRRSMQLIRLQVNSKGCYRVACCRPFPMEEGAANKAAIFKGKSLPLCLFAVVASLL